MKLRRSHLLLIGLALGVTAAGVAVLRYMPGASRPGAELAARVERGGGAFLQRLRGHMAAKIAVAPSRPPAPAAPGKPPAPEPGAEAVADASVAIAPQAEPPPTPEAPTTEIPIPPVRPADLASLAPPEPAVPVPPRRPRDLVASAEPAAEAAAAPAPAPEPTPPPPAAPVPAAAQPPAEPPPAPPTPLPRQQVARAPEPELRPAPDDAFTREQGPARFRMGQPAYVRIFKQDGQLELWLKQSGRFTLYKTYPICKWSGQLGPKQKEADYQSPEGFYSVSAKQLNPHSNYRRAFNVGYPNAYDRQLGRTGGLVMVHGACKSVGCFAMTDAGIDEIYGFVAAALAGGQREVPVHIFPFRMTESAVARHSGGGGWLSFVSGAAASPQWGDFWRNLKEGYDIFEASGEPPTAYACNGRYAFGGGEASCRRIAGW